MEEFNQNNIYSLKDAKNFLCLLNPEKFRTLEQYKSSLENVDFDILLIEPSINGEFFSREQIESLKKKSSGARRLVIAYLSIGEAEDYRYYWKKVGTKNTLIGLPKKTGIGVEIIELNTGILNGKIL